MTTQTQTGDTDSIYKNPENLSDSDLADEFLSYYLQIENDLPFSNGDLKYYKSLRAELSGRDNLEVLSSVRVVDEESEEVLV